MTRKRILILLLLFCAFPGKSQSVFCSFGYGVGYHSSRNQLLQDSYSSYETYIREELQQNNLSLTRIDPNFNSSQFDDVFSFHTGFSGDGIAFTVSYFQNKAKQSRSLIWSNNYGRNFDWYELRREVLFDIGYGGKHLDVYGSFGVHFDWYRMVTYQVYPDGTLSLTNQAGYNGVYQKYNTGITFGAGIKYKFKNYLALDLRYLFSRASKFEDGLTNDFGLSDNSYSKNPDFSYFPGDFTQPIGVASGNQLIPVFNRHLISLSVLYFLRFNDN